MLTGDYLRHSARRAPQRLAVAQEGQRWTYQQLDDAATRFARALLTHGVAPGTRIALLAPNIPEYAVAYFGAARAGCVSAHLSVRASPDEIFQMLDRIDAQAVAFDSASTHVIVAVLQRLDIRHALTLDAAAPPGAVGAVSLNTWLQSASDDIVLPELDPTAPLAITFTGGTTGKPKAVVVNHAARHRSALTAASEFGWRADDIILVATPLFHAAGLFVCFAPTMLIGATAVLLRTWNAASFLATVARERVTAALLVPTQLNDVISHPQFALHDLTSLREISYAGAPMSAALLDRLRRALPHVRFTENYGLSETGPLAVRRPEDPIGAPLSVGRRAPHTDVEVLREDGSSAAPNEIGEICTRGAHVFSGYLDDPASTAQAFREGDWLRTGDLGYFDANGFLILVDRLKDIIICGGENIYPAEIENALYRHPAVAECVAFGIPDERSGELPAAHVVLKPSATIGADALIDFCTTQIPRHKRPRLVRFVAALPRTVVGKIQRNAIRSEYWKGRASPI